jgi:hypothetical protein
MSSRSQLGAELRDDRVDALGAQLADLGVGERPIGGPELGANARLTFRRPASPAERRTGARSSSSPPTLEQRRIA